MNKYIFSVGVKPVLMTFKLTQVAMLIASPQPRLLKNALVGYVLNVCSMFSNNKGEAFSVP